MPEDAGIGTRSILFTDLEGSTAQRARVGDEAADELARELASLHRIVVESHRGEIVKSLGDGWMASFDSASDAVAAAVALQQRLDVRNRRADESLVVRAGVSAGDVAPLDGDLSGIPVVEAARLCDQATGGEILIADMVRILAGSRLAVPTTSVGALDLKGLAGPLPACRVEWAALPSLGTTLPTGLRSEEGFAFVGRTAEWAALNEAWDRVNGGALGFVLLGGEPGVGKTRLTAEFASAVVADGARIVFGACDEAVGVGYRPFAEALAAQLDDPEDHHRLGPHPGDLTRIVPEILRRRPGIATPDVADSDTERYRLFGALNGWLAELTADRPTVLVIDDVHWATEETQLFLRHLARQRSPSRLLIIGTYRNTEVHDEHPLAETITVLHRAELVTRIDLDGLDGDAVAQYLVEASGQELDDDTAELARRLHRQTEGVPFFLRELLLHLIETGVVHREGDGPWRVDLPRLDDTVPRGVKEVIRQRLTRLDPDARGVLGRAAVVGHEFGLDVLIAVCGRHDEDVLDVLDQASRARLVTEDVLDSYRFTHALVRATLLDDLSESRRARMHRDTARVLETQLASDPTIIGDLAFHHRSAGRIGDRKRAVDCTVLAAKAASAQLAIEEAVRLHRLAVSGAAELGRPEPEQRRRRIDLATALRQSGDPEHVGILLAEGEAALADGELDTAVEAAVALVRDFSIVRVDERRVAMYSKVLDAMPEDHPDRARVLAARATERVRGDRTDAAEVARDIETALALADAFGTTDDLVSVMLAALDAFRGPDEVERRRDLGLRLHSELHAVGDPVLVVLARNVLCTTWMELGETDAFRRDAGHIVDTVADLRHPGLGWVGLRRQVELDILAGDLAAAEHRLDEVLAVGSELGMAEASAIHAAMAHKVLVPQGRHQEAAELWGRWAGVLPQAGFAYGAALEAHRSGSTVEADALWAASPEPEAVARDWAFLETITLGAEAAAAFADRERAGAFVELLRPMRSLVATVGCGPYLTGHHALGLALAVVGDLDGAIAELNAAVDRSDELGLVVVAVADRLALADVLRRREAGDDRAVAALRAVEALQRSTALNLDGYATEARQLIDVLGDTT